MTVHVLDTGAVVVLLNRHRPPLLQKLEQVALAAGAIWIPAPVLIEIGQATQPAKKRMDRVMALADVAELFERHAVEAANGLRALKRDRCDKCSGFVRPTLVDAAVMALAAEYAAADDAIVYTQDDGDLKKLQTYFTSARLSVQRV
jgi:hypothetical protein